MNLLSAFTNHCFLHFSTMASYVWGLAFVSYHNPLFKLQKKVLRCIKFEKFSTPSTPIFQSLKILKLEDTLHLNIFTFVLAPSHFHNYFHRNTTVHKIGTRQATRGDLSKSLKHNAMYGLQTNLIFSSKHWNTLPLFIHVASSVTVALISQYPHWNLAWGNHW